MQAADRPAAGKWVEPAETADIQAERAEPESGLSAGAGAGAGAGAALGAGAGAPQLEQNASPFSIKEPHCSQYINLPPHQKKFIIWNFTIYKNCPHLIAGRNHCLFEISIRNLLCNRRCEGHLLHIRCRYLRNRRQ